MVTVRDLLQSAVEKYGTQQLLKKSKTCDGTGICWDDFLGNADSPPTYADRLFSTSIALNALFDTWTVNSKAGRSWKPETPANVLTAAKSAAVWLNSYVLSGKYPAENVFFSGSVKSPTLSMPFDYPTNFHHWLNGTAVTCQFSPQLTSTDLVVAVSGYIPPAEYDKLLNKTCFGNVAPTSYPGMNCDDCTFPYW